MVIFNAENLSNYADLGYLHLALLVNGKHKVFDQFTFENLGHCIRIRYHEQIGIHTSTCWVDLPEDTGDIFIYEVNDDF